MIRAGAFTLVALLATSISAHSATVQTITEGTRDTVAGTTNIGGDVASTGNGFTLNGGTALDAGDSVEIYGRIVGAIDRYNFTATSSVTIEWIFGGYGLEAGGTVATSGFVLEGSTGSNVVDLSVFTPDASGTQIQALANPYSTDITSVAGNGGTDNIFAPLVAGSYTLVIDNDSPSKAALYDIRITAVDNQLTAVPLPAGALLLLTGVAALGAGRIARRKHAA